MKISLDGGALCAGPKKRFGNYIFTKNLILALLKFAPFNHYYIYSFCQKPKFIKEGKNLIYKNLKPRIFWSKLRVSLEELSEKKDYFLALNQSLPLITSGKIISFSHGLSFYFFPKLYPDSFQQLKTQLDQMVSRSEKIIVSSYKVKEEIQSIKAVADEKIVVFPYGVPFDMIEDNLKLKIQREKLPEKFFLFVGMGHPIKNIDYIVNRFKEFKGLKQAKDYRLVLVSDISTINSGNEVIIVNNISRDQLKKLYQKATALLTASLYESFNLPVLEALALGCPVIGLKSAIIPELSSYVNLCESEEEFVLMMKKAMVNKLKSVKTKEIIKKFSWENYIFQLLRLFNPEGGGKI